MGDCQQAKLVEERFIARLCENMSASLESATVRNSDCVNVLRKLTGAKLLRRELESKYPLGKSVSVQVGGVGGLLSRASESVVLAGRVTLRLERYVEKGSDEEPLSLADLHGVLSEEADSANRNRNQTVLGLFSPTGWAPEAGQFVRNDPPGSGWASGAVRPILIGPEITELVWDTKDAKVREYVQHFCGLTVDERKRVCHDEIQKTVLVQDFANLQKIAEAKGLDVAFVMAVAKDFCGQNKDMKVATVRGVGPVVKRVVR